MNIASVGRAFPEHYYQQEDILEHLQALWRNGTYWNDKLASIHRNTKVLGRHLALPLEEYGKFSSFAAANTVWIDRALELGEAAIRDALDSADLKPADVSALFFVSVTGIATPSIDAMLVNRLGLPTNIKRIPIFGLGCVAGAAGLARANDYVKAYPDQIAVLLSVELCSLTFQPGDKSVRNMIASGLFADAASAVVIAGSERKAKGPQIVDTRSVFYPDTEDVMGWHVSETGFQLVLSPKVPEVVRENLAPDVDAFLADHGLVLSDISSWICHSGGPKVLTAIQESLSLYKKDLEVTWRSLANIGNVSSASVLLVLADTLQHSRPALGTYGLLLAMGPGFCSELVLLRF